MHTQPCAPHSTGRQRHAVQLGKRHLRKCPNVTGPHVTTPPALRKPPCHSNVLPWLKTRWQASRGDAGLPHSPTTPSMTRQLAAAAQASPASLSRPAPARRYFCTKVLMQGSGCLSQDMNTHQRPQPPPSTLLAPRPRHPSSPLIAAALSPLIHPAPSSIQPPHPSSPLIHPAPAP